MCGILFAFSRAAAWNGMAIVSNNSTIATAIISRFLPSFLPHGARNYGIYQHHQITASRIRSNDAIWLPIWLTIKLQLLLLILPSQMFPMLNHQKLVHFSFV